MAFNDKKLYGSDILDRYGSRIGVLETDVDQLKQFNGLSVRNVTFYVCPADANDSHTFIDTDKTTKLVGNDSTGTGEIDKPYATVQKAISRLQQFRAIAPIIYQINLHAGIYRYHSYEILNSSNQVVMNAYPRWQVRHCDTALGSGCYFIIEGYSWENHVWTAADDPDHIKDYDTDDIVVDGIDNPDDGLNIPNTVPFLTGFARLDSERNVILNNPVVFDIVAKGAPSGSYAPFAIFSPTLIRRITFRMQPGKGQYTNVKTNHWPIHQYSSDSMSVQYCKFFDWPNGAIRPRNPLRLGANIASEFRLCYFDNTKMYNGVYAPDYEVGASPGVALDCRSSANDTAVYIENCRFKYCSTAINTATSNSNLNFVYTPSYYKVNGVLTAVYRRNVITFEECVTCMQAKNISDLVGWHNSTNQFIDEYTSQNLKFKFINNVRNRTYKLYTTFNGIQYT